MDYIPSEAGGALSRSLSRVHFNSGNCGDYEVESDFLFEVFVVNKSDVTVTIEKYLAEAEIAGVWTELSQITDVADYQLDFGEEEHLPMGSFNKYEDLPNLYEQLKGVPLVKGVEHTRMAAI